jgi:hypothetical protein
MSELGLSEPGLCNQEIIFSTVLNRQYEAIYYNIKSLLNPNCPNNINMYIDKSKLINKNINLSNQHFNNKLKKKQYFIIINIIFISFSLICIINVFN